MASALNRWARWLHVYSAAPVLLFMIFFALTGVLLNHGTWQLGETRQADQTLMLPESLLAQDWQTESSQTVLQALSWLDSEYAIHGVEIEATWELEEQLLILHLAGPHGNYSVEVYPEEQIAEVFQQAWPFWEMLNNVHRGKHVTGLWKWLSDIAATCMLLFCLSGLWLLCANRIQRSTSLTWTGIGSIIMTLAIYLMH